MLTCRLVLNTPLATPARRAGTACSRSEPGSPAHDGLRLLASWAATDHREDHAESDPMNRPGASPAT